MYVTRSLYLGIIVTCIVHHCGCNRKTPVYKNFEDKFRNIAVSRDNVYIGGSNSKIYQLNSSLGLIQNKSVAGFPLNWLLDIDHFNDVLVACNYKAAFNTSCTNYNLGQTIVSNIPVVQKQASFKIEKPSARYIHTKLADKDVLIIASSSCFYHELPGDALCSAVSAYEDYKQLGNFKVEYKYKNSINHVAFQSVFQTDRNTDYIYFLYNTNQTFSKLGKICNDSGRWNSFEDLPVQCWHDYTLYSLAKDALFWKGYLFVTFIGESTSVICRYKAADIDLKYKESRQERLKCPYSEKVNSYFEKSVTAKDFCYNDTSKFCQSEMSGRFEVPCTEVTGEFCNTNFFGSVEGSLPLDTDDVVYLGDNSEEGSIIKLGGLLYSTHAVIYAGTSTGKIGRIFVSSKTRRPVGSFEIVQNLSPVLDIKVNGEDVYVMTENMVRNVANKEPCQGLTCEDCMKSENPYCGWDLINKSCNKNTKNISLWLPSTGGTCLVLQINEQRILEITDIGHHESLMVEFQLNLDLDLMDNNLCCANKYVISGREPVVQRTEAGYSCELTVDGESFMLNITTKESTVIASTTVQLYKCSNFTSCESCVTQRTCYWCYKNFTCVDNGIDCELEKINKNEENNCPKITSTELYITQNSVDNLRMNVDNIDYFYGEDEKLECLSQGISYDSSVNSDNSSVTCHNIEAAPIDSNEHQDVKLLYNGHPFDRSSKLTVYRCQNLERVQANCGRCKYFKSLGYKCDWCGNVCKSTLPGGEGSCTVPDHCPISVLKVVPSSGPVEGGTHVIIEGENLGNTGDSIVVRFHGVECINVQVLEPSERITCITGAYSGYRTVPAVNITVNGTIATTTTTKDSSFTYKEDISLAFFAPPTSILSGGRRIMIRGTNIGFEQHVDSPSRYHINFCDNTGSCVSCSHIPDPKPKIDSIRCRIGQSQKEGIFNNLTVTIDGKRTVYLTKDFTVKPNPKVTQLSPDQLHVFRSGGSKITIPGDNFFHVGEVRVDNVEDLCEKSNETVVCKTPPYVKSSFERRKRAIGQNINVHFDNYLAPYTIYYVEDPVFDKFTSVKKIGDDSDSIVIKGRNILEGAVWEEYTVEIGLDGRCHFKEEDVTNDNITCLPPKNVPRTNHSDKNVVYVLVKVGRIQENLGFIEYVQQINVMLVVIGVLSALFVTSIILGTLLVVVYRRKRKQALKDFQMELQSREDKVREASREEFADAQMTIRDIKTDLVTSRVPYFDYQRYVFHQLFPNQDMDTHPLLHEPMITDDNRKAIQKALDMFDKLMTNKLFLKSLVQTLDNKVKLTMKDKAHFASLLSVGLLGNMKLFYQLISSLLSEMIKSASKKQQKILFRRFESITQRLTVNWLEMTLYDHLKTQSGMQLFMLYKATQTVIEKAPIDAVTNHCKNTLAEERLLKNRVEYETMTLHIDLNGTKEITIPVVVLDCDTISQVKHKCCTAIYKNKPASEIPRPDELELEWHHGRGGKLTLQDIDNISERSNGLVRLNTLKHYLVKDGSEMALMYRESHGDDPDEIYVNTPETDYVQDEEENQHVQGNLSSPDHVKLLMPDRSSTVEQDIHRWHLSNLTDEEKSNKEHEIGELFLNRLFHTKLILKDYIEAAFEGIMDSQSLALPVRYFLCMLDKLGKEESVDGDVLQSWKSECYATRVWASLISKPQILFDVDVPSHVEPCMDILKQVFIDSFTQGAQNVTKDASTQKLLFCKDIPDYRRLVNSFFLKVEPVADQDFWKTMDQISDVQSRELKFSKQATLHQLYSFIAKYKDEIIEDFEDKDETKDLAFGRKLEEVIELMEE